MAENEIGTIVVDAAVKIHMALGPGLLESVYEIVLAHELSKRGLHVERQIPIPIQYDGIKFDEGFSPLFPGFLSQKTRKYLGTRTQNPKPKTQNCGLPP